MPEIAEDFRHSFEHMDALCCVVFLGAHDFMFDLAGKRAGLGSGETDARDDARARARIKSPRRGGCRR
jgi:hypothetical protein